MTQLHEAMTEIAENASEPPADLLDRVVAGHGRRRRRRHTTIAAAAAVLVLVTGGWAALRPPGGKDEMPAGFQLPADVSTSPLMPWGWPVGFWLFGDLPDTPDGGRPVVLGGIGEDQVLVAGRDSLERWSPYSNRYHPQANTLGYIPEPDRTYLSPQWIVSVQQTGETAVVWRYWKDGGSRKRAAEVTVSGDVRGVYATDDYAYLSAGGRGVLRVTLASGASEWLPGFDDLVSDGSGWARNADGTVYRQLTTGEEVRQPRPPGAQSWECVPAFCLGQSGGTWFVQDPGGVRENLRYPGTPSLIGPLGDSGVLRVADGVILNPKNGSFFKPTGDDKVVCDAEFGRFKSGIFYRSRTAPNGGSCDGPWETMYM